MKKVCLSLALSALFLLCTAARPDELEKIRKAPPLTFIIPGSGQHSIAEYQGKVLALEFISTTCPHCRDASYLMTKLQNEYGPKGFQVIDVAVNQNADLLVDNFAKDYHVGFPVGWTTSDQEEAFMGFSKADRSVVPQLVLIDRKGVIHYQTPATGELWNKYMSEDTIRRHIEQLLALR